MEANVKCDKEQHARQTRSLFISLSVLTMYSRTWLWKFCSLIVTSSSSILHIAETHSLATHFCGVSIHCKRKRIYGIIRPTDRDPVASQRRINDQNTVKIYCVIIQRHTTGQEGVCTQVHSCH